MKRYLFLLYSTAVLALSLFAAPSLAETDIDQHRDCALCGMDRKAYGYSRMVVEYKEGNSVATCSLHCVVTELNGNNSGKVISFKVADRNTRRLIDAERAFWTIGGSKRGVMTTRAKWAFESREGARKFVAAYGGTPATWDEALAAAREDAASRQR